MSSSSRFFCSLFLVALAGAGAGVVQAQAFDCSGISSVIPTNADLDGDLTSLRVGSGFSSPVYLAVAPDDDERLFIVEQPGQIKIIKNGTALGTAFLDIRTIVGDAGNEEGLLSMAFHPEYQTNGLFWVYYTNNAGNIDIARYAVSANPDVANAASGQVMITVPHPGNNNHDGGQLAFSPADGRLYAGTGDGGSGCDPGPGDGNAQNKNNLLGKMLRFDVSTGALASYSTTGNPFDGITPGLDEIWSTGMRNPYRFSFDAVSGNIYIGDVGQGVWEEVDCSFPPSEGGGGENYGWVFHEGSACPNPSCGGSIVDCDPPDYVDPIYEYNQAGTPCSVIGGFVYRGCRMVPLRGTYFLADYCDSNYARSFRTDDTCAADPIIQRAADLKVCVGGTNDGNPCTSSGDCSGGSCGISLTTSFGQDNQGELYMLARSGSIFKIVPNFNIHVVSGQNTTPFTMGADWVFEDLGATADWPVENYRIYRSNGPDGSEDPFNCVRLIKADTDCSGGTCTWVGGDTANPASGSSFYYLVTGLSGGRHSSPGVQSDGSPRIVNPLSFCPLNP